MATITSAQSGYWDDPTTWVGGTVPDLSVDDVVIANYHAVTADGSSRTLAGGRQITVNPYGLLEVAADLTVQSGASVHVQGGLTLWAYLEVQGYLELTGGGWLEDSGVFAVVYGANVDVGGSVSTSPYAVFDVTYGSSLHVSGSFTQDWGGYSTFNQGAYVSILAGGVAYFSGNLYVDTNGAFHVFGDADFDSGSVLEVRYGGSLYVESGGSVSIANYAYLTDSGAINVYGDLSLGGSLYVYGYSQVYVEYGGTFTINGYLNVDNYSTLTVYGGNLTLSRWAGIEASYESTVYFDYLSRTDLFGYFRLYSDAWLYLGWDAVVRVYRDVNISGRMESSGGKFVMLRREGRINDADGESLFVFDQAYGFEPHLVA